MNLNISVLRDTGDFLYEQKNYQQAFALYSEVYNTVWFVIGRTYRDITTFSRNYFTNKISKGQEFKNAYNSEIFSSACKNYFNLSLEDTHNEFIFALYGRLRCIQHSMSLISLHSAEKFYDEMMILFALILNMADDKWITELFRVANPMFEEDRLKKIINIKLGHNYNERLIESAKQIKNTDWYGLNILLLEYMDTIQDRNTDLYWKIKNVVGPYNKGFEKKSSRRKAYSNYEKYEKYEKYERYTKYERYESKASTDDEEFDVSKASKKEKDAYYAKVLGLKGRIKKAEIRKCYIDLLRKYHPDKVADLGDELLELAKRKTQLLNDAYTYMKEKYNLK